MNKFMPQEQWEEEFDKAFPTEIREVYKDGKGNATLGVVLMNKLIKDFIRQRVIASTRTAEREATIKKVESMRKEYKTNESGEYSFADNMKTDGYNQALDDLIQEISGFASRN